MPRDLHPGSGEFTRRRALGLFGAGIGATAAVGSLSGCGGSSTGGGGSSADMTPPDHVAGKEIEGLLKAEAEGVSPIYVGSPSSYTEAVTEKPAKGGKISSFQILWGAPTAPRAENQVWQELEKKLGVDEFDITMIPSASYGDKLATLLASGNLPDLVYIQDDDPNAARALADGAFLELNEYLEGDKVKAYPNLASTPTDTWVNSAKNGKILGVPMPAPPVNNLMVLRLDAMKKVGANGVPDNGDDLKTLWLELAKLGEVAGRKVWTHGELKPETFEPLHDLGNMFQMEDGKVTCKYLLPQYEDHLAFMVELWKGGMFHPDALGQMDPELFQQGQQLNYQASFPGFYWIPDQGRINTCRKAVPTAEFIHYPMPSVKGGTGKHELSRGYSGMVCIPSSLASDEEKVKTLLRVCNFYRSPLGSTENLFLSFGIEGRQFKFDGPDKAIVKIPDAPNEGACTWLGLLRNPVNLLPRINKDKADNILETYSAITSSNKLSEVDKLTSVTYAKSASKLSQIHKEYFNGIVSGRKPVSAVKDFQKAWRDGGGQAVLDDYTKMLNEKK